MNTTAILKVPPIDITVNSQTGKRRVKIEAYKALDYSNRKMAAF